MGARALLGAMVVGSALLIGLGRRRDAPAPAPAPPRQIAEEPWLSRDATAQLVAEDGAPGPLFAGAILGGPAPAPDVRARIAEFARHNKVTIALEITGGDLAAIRIEVAFSGCCGYEAADVLALRLHRPSTGNCCVCGGEDKWFDDWTTVVGDTVHVRARVRVNKVGVRWEPVATPADLVARADALLGKTVAELEKQAGDRWTALAWQSYSLETPFPSPLERRDDFGMHLTTDHGKVVEVSFRRSYDDTDDLLDAAARARWGRPRVTEDGETWRMHDRTITLDERLTIHARS